MARLLVCYAASRDRFNTGIGVAMPAQDEIWRQQERLYRISVLENCQMLVMTAPKSTDIKSLHWHYLMVDAFFQSLTQERCYSPINTEKEKKQRETAHGSLLKVIQDYRSRFSSFAPGTDAEFYQKTISAVVQTVLPVWIQFRQSYIEVNKEEIQNEQQ